MNSQALPKYSRPEIERRWRVPLEVALGLPVERVRIVDDLYLAGGRLRLRRIQVAGGEAVYKLGKKYVGADGAPLASVSVYLSYEEYLSLAGQPGRSSCKERRSMAQGALDVYRWPALDFAVFEREYDTPQAALLDAAPPFAQAEITGLADFSGYGLARERDA